MRLFSLFSFSTGDEHPLAAKHNLDPFSYRMENVIELAVGGIYEVQIWGRYITTLIVDLDGVLVILIWDWQRGHIVAVSMYIALNWSSIR